MAEIESLDIIIEVIEKFEQELNLLLFKLGEVATAMEAVDNIDIDVTVHGERQLDALMAKMLQLEGMDLAGVGNVSVGAGRRGFAGRGGGGGGMGGGVLAGMQVLNRNMREAFDSLEENLDGLGESMGRTMTEADKAADQFEITNLRMSDMHNAMARLVPLIVVFIGTIPALIGGMAAVASAAVAAATALASLTGFAALGFAAEEGGRGDLMGGMGEAVDQVVEDFLDAFLPLAERLAPLFRDALDGLDRLFQEIANEGDALVDLTDQARDFGQFIINTLPGFLRDLAQFAEATSGALGAIVQAAGDIDVFAVLANALDRVLPLLMEFGALLVGLISHLFGMSIGFLRVANAILTTLNIFMDIITVGGMFDEQLGFIIGSLLSLLTVTLLLNSSFLTMAAKTLVAVGKRLVWLATVNKGLRTSFLQAKFGADTLTAGVINLRNAIAGLLATTGIGLLLSLVGKLAGSAIDASSDVDELTGSLKSLEQQRNSMSTGKNPFRNPDIGPRGGTGQSRFAGSSINVNVEGDADEQTLRTQTQNAMYRMERTRRSR